MTVTIVTLITIFLHIPTIEISFQIINYTITYNIEPLNYNCDLMRIQKIYEYIT